MGYENSLRWITIQYIGPENHRALFVQQPIPMNIPQSYPSNVVANYPMMAPNGAEQNIVTGVPYVKPMIPMQQNRVEINDIDVKRSEFGAPSESQGKELQDPENPVKAPM